MNNKLYVGNLSFHLTSDDLHDFFSRAGTVESAKVIEDRDTGRSRGFGFVEMATPEQAQLAIDQLNGHDLERRSLVVSEVRDSDRAAGGGRKR